MVMSGDAERIVFLHHLPGDEALLTGGTIARLHAGGALVVVLFDGAARETVSDVVSAQAKAALAELGVNEWRMLPPDSGDNPSFEQSDRESALREVVADVRATAVVIGAIDDRLRGIATLAAHEQRVPVFLSRRVSDAGGQRLIAIDVSDHVADKLRAIAAYTNRWSVTGTQVSRPDGTEVVVGRTENYIRLDAPFVPEEEPTLGARAIASTLALVLGAAFGVIGTIAHQATLVLGGVAIPIGLILALFGASALLVGLRLVVNDRWVVLSCALGMLGTIFVLSLRSSGGSVLIPEGIPGTLWTVVPAIVAALALAWPRISAQPRSA